MFGHRTPIDKKVKPSGPLSPNKETKKKEEQPSIERSLTEEFEVGTQSPLTSTGTKTETQTKTTKMSQPSRQIKSSTVGVPRGKSAGSPHIDKTKSRIEQAMAWVGYVKEELGKPRNTKTEIVDKTLKAIDKLLEIVKESEAELAESRRDKCEKTYDVILTKINENNTLLRENGNKMEDLQRKLQRHTEAEERGTYADAVAANQNTRMPQNRAALHSIIITSEKKEETGQEIFEKIRKAVDAKEGWIQVEKVRKAKDRKIVVGCKTQEERKKLRERLENAGQNLIVEEIKNKRPLLVLKGVTKMHSDEDVLHALKNQNRTVFDGLNGEDAIAEIKYKKKNRNPHIHDIVLNVSPTIWQRALAKKKVKIDLQQVDVKDQTPLVQCTRCLGYGHSKRFCKDMTDLCSHCGEPHLSVDCPDKKLGQSPTCINCTRAKVLNNQHNAFNEECPIRKKWDSLARSAIAYC